MKRNAFTFIEVIISILIFTIVAVTVYSTFNMGIKTWRRGQDKKSLQKIRLALLKMEKEIKDTFFFSKAPFKGFSEEMVFPLIVSSGDRDDIYIVAYSVGIDEGTGLSELARKQKPFSEEIEDEEWKIKIFPFLTKEIKFEYAYGSDDSLGSQWQESWNSEKQQGLPSGVRVSLEMDEEEEVYSKIIWHPRSRIKN